MSLTITCKQCGQRFGVAPHLFGRSVNCTRCGSVLCIPNPTQAGLTQNAATVLPASPYAVQPDQAAQKHIDKRLLMIIATVMLGAVVVITAIIGIAFMSHLNREPILQVELDPSASISDHGIVFVSDREGTKDLFTMNGSGGHERRLTNTPAEDAEPCWSPDGKYIAFSRKTGRRSEIFIVNSDGSHPQQLTDHRSTSSGPAWSPDGTRIAYYTWVRGNYDIKVITLADATVHNLTNSRLTETYPSWSPDGQQLLFHRQERDGEDWNIYTMNSDGGNQRSLTSDKQLDWLPTFSPSGEHIAFWSTRDGGFELYKMDADGGDIFRIPGTSNSSGWISRPAWSPHGDRIAISTDMVRGNLDIVAIIGDGSGRQILTESEGEDSDPHWRH